MPFEKGHKLAKGRPVGVENVTTKKGKELLIEVIEGQMSNVHAALEELRLQDVKAYLDILTKYMKFVIPEKSDISSGGEKLRASNETIVTFQNYKDEKTP